MKVFSGAEMRCGMNEKRKNNHEGRREEESKHYFHGD